MAAYLHKKFKKFASSEQQQQPPRGREEAGAATSDQPLKHSVGNMVGESRGTAVLSSSDMAAQRRLSSSSEERMTPPEFDTSMAKTYYCEVCRFAFREGESQILFFIFSSYSGKSAARKLLK